MSNIKHKRGTLSALDTLKNNSQLVVGQLYYLTDVVKIAIATAVNAYDLFESGAKASATHSHTETLTTATNSLTLDLATNNVFVCSLNANASFSLSNVVTGKIYYFICKSTNGAMTITLPNTADVKSTLTVVISAINKYREISMFYDGTTRFWQISEELT